MLIGYARVSTERQDLAAQLAELGRLGIERKRIYTDKRSGKATADRPGLREAIAAASEGDVLVVTRLDRLARSVPDARDIVEQIYDHGAALQIGTSVHDPNDAVGRFLFNALAMVAEFERDLISQRTKEGLAIARSKGRLNGKPPKLSPKRAARLLEDHESGTYTSAELAELYGVSRATVYRYVQRATSTTGQGSHS